MSAALSPRNADVLSDLGLALMHTRRFAAADSAFTQALDLDASRPLLWYNYATLLGTMGRLDEAERAFERVLALQPSFHDAEEKLLLTRRIRAGHVPQRK
jgi:Flp pilus assembly protein TadD